MSAWRPIAKSHAANVPTPSEVYVRMVRDTVIQTRVFTSSAAAIAYSHLGPSVRRVDDIRVPTNRKRN
jgi:hypothetical protein